ncbi:MAG: hypothetical protein Udaeo_10130 [Candidatus Udaeobacter sp.]|nr:MAG: hypothetical protein Udaeo_10130 [Candidatus Udaeobacter sp.]
MFRCDYQECAPVKRVGTRCENANLLIYILNLKIDLRAFASPNPIALERFDSSRPIKALEFIEQSLRISSDAQHPLPHWSSNNRKAANLAFSIYNLLIRQDCAQLRTPVHWDVSDVSESNAVRIGPTIGGNRLGPVCLRIEPGVVDLQENPLRPSVVTRVSRVDFPLPIVGKTDPLQLALELRHVFTGGDRRMLTGFDRVLLRGQTEGVPAHRVQNVEAAQPLIARNDVGRGVAFRMTNVQPRPAGIRKHIEHVEFWLRWIETLLARVGRVKNLVLVPDRLPFRLDLVERIWFTAVATHFR